MIQLLGLLPFAEKILDKVFPDPAQAAEAKVRLLEMQQNGELAKLANDAELFKAEVADRDSARKRESDIAVAEKAPLLNKIVTPMLALGVVSMTFALFGVVVFDSDAIEQGKKELVMYILGSLTSISGMVLSYYFGSSSSSQQKNNVIASLSR
jgi:hypothetical protein